MSRTPPNQQTAFGHHARDISSQLQVAVDEGLDQEGIKSRQGRRFHRRRKPAKQSDEGHHREKKFPLGCPKSSSRFFPAKGSARRSLFRPLPNPPPGRHDHH